MSDTFKEWMAEVDEQVQVLACVSVYDLPDCLFRDWYDDELTPRQAARRAIRNATDEDE